MKKAFTIAEFILCLVVMSTVMAGMLSVTFKKSKMTEAVQKTHNEFVCSCSDDAVKQNNYACEFDLNTEVSNSTGRHEFFTIQLLGGGAGGSVCRGGAAGEAKIITYPNLESGKYIIKLGTGGKGGQSPYNGGNTVLYKIDDKGNYRVVEFARGGVAEANDTAMCDYYYQEVNLYSDTQTRNAVLNRILQGEAPTFSQDQEPETQCGAGGYRAQNGRYGEVVIKW